MRITPDGPTDIQPGDDVVLDAAGTGFTNFEWSTGETTASITVTAAGNYSVTASDADGCTQTAIQEVTVLSSVADLNQLKASVKVFPNPNNGDFSLSYTLNEAQEVSLFVVDITGQVILSQDIVATSGENNHQLNLNKAAAGIYFVRLQTADGSVNTRMIVE